MQYADLSTVSYTYDAGNRVTQMVDSANGTISRGYDGLDRLNSETTAQGSISYTYDNGSRRSTMSVAGQPTVNYTYDNGNRLTQITQGTATVTMGYDNANRRTSVTLPNGIVAAYSYDAASRVTGIAYTLGSTTIGNLMYTYDGNGRRTTMGGSLAQVNLPAAISSVAYNANNQLANWNGSTQTYDADGNLTNDGTTAYTWNSRNQLAAFGATGFAYDALGRRTQNAAGKAFLYDGVNAVQELSGGTVTANLLTGMGVDEIFSRTDSAGARNLLTDTLGSTLALTDSSGTVQTQYTYEPFGKATTSGQTNSNTFEYTGRESDGTGLDYYRARYYSPSLQRFISEDPIRLGGGSTNFYSYVANSPTNLRDPSGRCWPTAIAGGAIGFGWYTFSHRKDFSWGGAAAWTGAGALAGCGVGLLAEGALAAGLTVPEGTGALYTGANGAALDAATNGGFNLITNTPVGSLANTFIPNSWGAVWDYLSSLYAEGLTGEVTVFQGEMTAAQYGNSLMVNTELPIVMRNFGTTVSNIVWVWLP